jgi:multiple sugar transport system substrate-binding protein
VLGKRNTRSHSWRRLVILASVVTVSSGVLAACGGGETGPPTLNWYINNAQQEPLAPMCAEASGGQYDIKIQLLPTAASGQREQLLRRLAANDSSIDIMSIDPPFMAEFAQAGFLRPFTDEEKEEFSEGVLRGPLEQSLFEDTMYSAPFYGNTQLLWYKKSVAQQAGLDMTKPVTWDQLIEAAEKTGTRLGVQGRKNESLMVWVNALVQSTGGTILSPDSEGKPAEEVEPSINDEGGREAARIMRTIANSSAAPPALDTAGEEESRAAFQAEDGGFMVNWPYVWAAFDTAIKDGAIPENFKDDVAWTRYPQTKAGEDSSTPLGGIGLSVGAFSKHPDLAVDAIRCLRSVESQIDYMKRAGDPGASSAVFDDPAIQEQFPMYEAIREGLTDAGPRPISPFYGDVTGVIQESYHPPDALSPDTTPEQTADMLRGVLRNEQLL